MGFMVGDSGKWSIEARSESFYLIYEQGPDDSRTFEVLYGDVPTLLGAIEMLRDYLVKQGRLHQIGDQYLDSLSTQKQEAKE